MESSQGRMSLREHFTLLGIPKVARTEQNAREYAADHYLNAYECSFCGEWHVGTLDYEDE